jgi:(R,R)-butanediol dehydrogenase/meso-butanediol dehydrogenase/diacetyl reductase
MRAAVVTGRHPALEVRDVPDPAPEAGDLVLSVSHCGICGSDLHLGVPQRATPGLVLGHEFCGEVVAIGPEVDGWKLGDRVVGFPLTGCRRCPACLSGFVWKCPLRRMTGLEPGRSGAYAEYVAVGADEAFRMPDALDDACGALVEPMAVAHHVLERSVREPGEPILVLGAGPIGAAVALWARHLGASAVLVSDPVPGRRALVETLGAATVDPANSDVAQAFADLTGGEPRVVIECVGVPGLIQHAADVAGTSGHVTIAGVCVQPDTLNPLVSVGKELTLSFATWYRRRDFAMTIAQVASGRLDPQPLVTHRVSLDELPAQFEALMHPTTQGKVLIEPFNRD